MSPSIRPRFRFGRVGRLGSATGSHVLATANLSRLQSLPECSDEVAHGRFVRSIGSVQVRGFAPTAANAYRSGMSSVGSGRSGAAVWALVALVASASVSGLEPSLLEEGLQLHTAERLAAGDRMFRDFASFTGPAALRAARPALPGLRPRDLGGPRRARADARRGLRRHLRAGARGAPSPREPGRRDRRGPSRVLLFPLVAWYWYSTVCLHLCGMAGVAALYGLRSPRWAFGTGVLVSAVALCKQNVGVALALGLAVPIALEARSRPLRAGAYVAGGIASAALVLGYYGLRGDLVAMIEQMVLWPLDFQATFAVPFPNFWPPGSFAEEIDSAAYYLPSLYTVSKGGFVDPTFPLVLLTQALFALPFAALALVPIRWLWRRDAAGEVLIQSAIVLALTLQLWPRSDWGHICYVVPAALVLLLMLVPSPPAGSWAALARPAARAVTASSLVATVAATLHLHGLVGEMDYGPQVPLRAVSQASRQVLVPKTIEYLRENVSRGEPIFVAPLGAAPVLRHGHDEPDTLRRHRAGLPRGAAASDPRRPRARPLCRHERPRPAALPLLPRRATARAALPRALLPRRAGDPSGLDDAARARRRPRRAARRPGRSSR